jgi:hypothetical protein
MWKSGKQAARHAVSLPFPLEDTFLEHLNERIFIDSPSFWFLTCSDCPQDRDFSEYIELRVDPWGYYEKTRK